MMAGQICDILEEYNVPKKDIPPLLRRIRGKIEDELPMKLSNKFEESTPSVRIGRCCGHNSYRSSSLKVLRELFGLEERWRNENSK